MSAVKSNHSEWAQRAENDLRTVEALAALKDAPWEIVAFHVQQSAEKFLKAYLLKMGWMLRKTHDLLDLQTDCLIHDSSLSVLQSDCQELTPYVLSGRYPIAVVRSASEIGYRSITRVRTEILKRLS